MTALLALHLVAALAAPLLVRWWGRSAFLALALVPGAASGWVLAQLGSVIDGRPVTETTPWIPTLDLTISLRLDQLSLTLAGLVTGVGALVLVYCARYFEPDDEGLARFAGSLTAFAGFMLGLVLADDMLLLYVFWELTTVFSFLLIGGSGTRLAGRRAASQALVPAAGFGWVLSRLGPVLAGEEQRETVPWIPVLDLDVALRLDALALTFAALVTGVGALVLVYCARYFGPDDEGTGRFAGCLTAFAGSMLGLVLADDLLLLYVFWELTTIFSYLLIGGSGARLAARRAASRRPEPPISRNEKTVVSSQKT